MNCTDTIIRQVADIGRLVDEFSDFARMPAPIIKIENIAKICSDSIILFEAAHRNIEFETFFDIENIFVSCDSGQIGQALTNLLQNSVESIEELKSTSLNAEYHGSIKISILNDNDNVVISVNDNGRGLPNDRTIDSHIKRIRKKFKKVDDKFSSIETRYGSGYRWNIS